MPAAPDLVMAEVRRRRQPGSAAIVAPTSRQPGVDGEVGQRRALDADVGVRRAHRRRDGAGRQHLEDLEVLETRLELLARVAEARPDAHVRAAPALAFVPA